MTNVIRQLPEINSSFGGPYDYQCNLPLLFHVNGACINVVKFHAMTMRYQMT